MKTENKLSILTENLSNGEEIYEPLEVESYGQL